jgi:hypothetical protein
LTGSSSRPYNAPNPEKLSLMLQAVSFKQINAILELTDRLGLSREWVEIPLSPASPGIVRKLSNGKIEIVVDADVPFDQWLTGLETKITQLAGP